MSLEDFSPDIDTGSEWGGQSAEASREQAEKFKESAKRGAAGIKRTQKDEKKAKKQDFLLANFLVKIILEKKFDFLLEDLFACIDDGTPSNFILGVLSLVYVDISHAIRNQSGKPQIKFDYHLEIGQAFDDHDIAPEVKDRINLWVEDMVDVVSVEYSSLQTERLIGLLGSNEKLLLFTMQVFSFFFKEINMSITETTARNYCQFILGEVKKTLTTLEVEEI